MRPCRQSQVPAWTDAYKKRMIQDTLKVISREPCLTNYLMGDFNAIRPGEYRMHPDSLDRTVPYDPFSEWLEGKLSSLIELFQDDYTRCGRRESGQISVLSRIDRIYSDLPTVECLDRRIFVRTIGKFTAQYKYSDHLAVSATIPAADTEPPTSPVIPRWVFKDPGFAKSVTGSARIQDPFDKLAYLKN